MSLRYQINLDSFIWNKFRKGNDLYFKKIYQTHIKYLLLYGLKFTNDRELVKDCIHDLFVDLYIHRETLGETNKIRPYLFICLKRKIIKSLKQTQNNISLNIEELPFLVDYSLEKNIDFEETEQLKKKLLSEALNNLSSRQKEVIYLRFIEELEYEEISQLLEINYQSARNLIHRAIEQLREIITSSDLDLLKKS